MAEQRILVVDDEPSVRTILQRTLRKYDVETAESGRNALDNIEAGGRYDLILCDLYMPGLTGMDLHDLLLSKDPDQARRMVFLTGGTHTDRATSFMNGAGRERIDKPFRARELRARVSELLTKFSAQPA